MYVSCPTCGKIFEEWLVSKNFVCLDCLGKTTAIRDDNFNHKELEEENYEDDYCLEEYDDDFDLEENFDSEKLIKKGYSGENLRAMDFSNASLRGVDFSNAILIDTNFSGADLSRADLHMAKLNNSNLRGTNLRKANLRKVDLEGADIKDANFIEADFRSANLSNTNLNGANFYRADFSGADLSNSDLSDANLCEANLSGAYLHNANLSGADLSNTGISGANFSGAVLNNIIIEEDDVLLIDNIDLYDMPCDNHRGQPKEITHERIEAEGIVVFSNYSKMSYPVPSENIRNDVCNALLWIIHEFGPLMWRSVYQLYRKDCSAPLQADKWFRDIIDNALNDLLESGKIIKEDEFGDGSPESLVLRFAGTPKVRIRPAGWRTFHEIPASELLALMERLNPKNNYPYNLLKHYGCKRLTRPRRSHLDRVLKSKVAQNPSVTNNSTLAKIKNILISLPTLLRK